MADIELVIKINEETYKKCKWKNNGVVGLEWWERAIANGTQLPKGHGDLVDRDAINERFYFIYNDAMNCSNKPSDKYLLDKWSMCLDTALPIIEADEGESEDAE